MASNSSTNSRATSGEASSTRAMFDWLYGKSACCRYFEYARRIEIRPPVQSGPQHQFIECVGFGPAVPHRVERGGEPVTQAALLRVEHVEPIGRLDEFRIHIAVQRIRSRSGRACSPKS